MSMDPEFRLFMREQSLRSKYPCDLEHAGDLVLQGSYGGKGLGHLLLRDRGLRTHHDDVADLHPRLSFGISEAWTEEIFLGTVSQEFTWGTSNDSDSEFLEFCCCCCSCPCCAVFTVCSSIVLRSCDRTSLDAVCCCFF